MDRLNRMFQNGGMGVNSAPPGAVSELALLRDTTMEL